MAFDCHITRRDLLVFRTHYRLDLSVLINCQIPHKNIYSRFRSQNFTNNTCNGTDGVNRTSSMPSSVLRSVVDKGQYGKF